VHKRHFLIRGLILGLSIGVLVYCGRINNHDTSSSGAESSSGDNGSDGTESSDGATAKTTVQITVSLMEQSAPGAPTSTTMGLQVVAFDVTVAGCTNAPQQYNKTYSDIPFAYPSTTRQFTLPGDDAACYLSLSKLTVKNFAGATDQRSEYQHSSTNDLENASDRDSGGVMIFARGSGNIGPGKITFEVTKSNWLNEAAPATGAKMSYTFRFIGNR
jgi:hypothetical protein